MNFFPDLVKTHYDEINVYKAVDEIIATLHLANLFFEKSKPWELKKSNINELNIVLHLTMETLRICGIILQPIIPDISCVLLNKLAVENNRRRWHHLEPYSWETESDSKKIEEGTAVLFKRIVKDGVKTKAVV